MLPSAPPPSPPPSPSSPLSSLSPSPTSALVARVCGAGPRRSTTLMTATAVTTLHLDRSRRHRTLVGTCSVRLHSPTLVLLRVGSAGYVATPCRLACPRGCRLEPAAIRRSHLSPRGVREYLIPRFLLFPLGVRTQRKTFSQGGRPYEVWCIENSGIMRQHCSLFL